MGNEKLTAEQIMKAARTMAGALIGIEGVLRVLDHGSGGRKMGED